MKKLVASLLFLCTLSSFAQPRTDFRRFYIAYAGGYDFFSANTGTRLPHFSVDIPAFPALQPLRLEGGYFFTPNWGIALNYRFTQDLGKISIERSRTEDSMRQMERLEVDVNERMNYLGLNFLSRWPLAQSRFSLDARLGAGCLFDAMRVGVSSLSLTYSNSHLGYTHNQINEIREGTPRVGSKSSLFMTSSVAVGCSASLGCSFRASDLLSFSLSAESFWAHFPRINSQGSIYNSYLTRTVSRLGLTGGVAFHF